MPISQTTKYISDYPLGVASYICIAFFRKCFEKILLPLKRFDLVLLSSAVCLFKMLSPPVIYLRILAIMIEEIKYAFPQFSSLGRASS